MTRRLSAHPSLPSPRARAGAPRPPTVAHRSRQLRRALWLAGLLAATAAPVQAQVLREQPLCDRRTDICEYYPPVGSHVRRAAAHGMRLDIDRRYADLTAEDKARLHDQYERMPPGDEPPYPLDGLRPVYRSILAEQDRVRTQEEKILRADQEMLLLVEVGADGEPLAVKALSGARQPELVRLVAAVLMTTRYKPAGCAGQPCRMGFPFTFGVQTNLHAGPLR